MEVEDYRQKPKPEDAGEDYKPEWETVKEWKTINSMVPLWQRPKSKVKPEEYNAFYKEKFMDWQDPLAKCIGNKNFHILRFVIYTVFLPAESTDIFFRSRTTRSLSTMPLS